MTSEVELYMDALSVYELRNETTGDPPRRLHWPSGHWRSDGVWFPNPEEVVSCCKELRIPRQGHSNYRNTLLKHCCTYVHIANLFQVDPLILRRLVKKGVSKKDHFARLVLITAALQKKAKS